MWLEQLAGSELDRAEAETETMGSSGAFFTPGEGLPRETLARMEQSAVLAQMRPAASHVMVSQLDPDAPTRYSQYLPGCRIVLSLHQNALRQTSTSIWRKPLGL